MSINTSSGISISVEESGKVDGVRCIKGYALTIPSTQPKETVQGGTDYVDGVGYKLTISEAEELYEQLGSSLAFIKPLLESGKIKEIK